MEKELRNTNSIGMFNLAKGILMVGVILGHTLTLFFHYWEPQYTTQWWYYCLFFLKVIFYGMIPPFFMISGYSYYCKCLKKSIKIRLKHVWKPYILIGMIVTLLSAVSNFVNGVSVKEAVWNHGVSFLLGICPGGFEWKGHYIDSIGPAWFLVALVGASIILDVIFILDSEIMRGLCVISLVAFATRLPFYSFIPYCVLQAMCCAGYMYVGYFIREKDLLNRKIERKEAIAIIILSCCVMPFGNIEVSQNVWALGMLDYIMSGVLGFLVLYLFVYFNRFKGKLANIVREYGRNSLYILCVHTIDFLVFPWQRVQQFLAGHVIIGFLLVSAIRLGIAWFGAHAIIRVMKKYRTLRKRKGRKVPK